MHLFVCLFVCLFFCFFFSLFVQVSFRAFRSIFILLYYWTVYEDLLLCFECFLDFAMNFVYSQESKLNRYFFYAMCLCYALLQVVI